MPVANCPICGARHGLNLKGCNHTLEEMLKKERESMVSNFPPGAAGDKRAPYNQEDPEMIPWEALQHEDCGNCGAEAVWCNEDGICEVCYERDPKHYEQDDVIFDKGYEE